MNSNCIKDQDDLEVWGFKISRTVKNGVESESIGKALRKIDTFRNICEAMSKEG